MKSNKEKKRNVLHVKRKRESEAKLCEEEASAKLEYEAGQMIISEANQKLAAAIKDKNFKQISIAQMMLEQGEKKIRTSSNCLVNISKERHTLLVDALADSGKSADRSTKRHKDSHSETVVN